MRARYSNKGRRMVKAGKSADILRGPDREGSEKSGGSADNFRARVGSGNDLGGGGGIRIANNHRSGHLRMGPTWR